MSPTNADALKWIGYAAEDLKAAKALLSAPEPSYRNTCFLCQQAVEKALKSALIALNLPLERTHNLNALRNQLPEGWKCKFAFPDLSALSIWAVEARYPGDWDEATLQDAQKALSQATEVVALMRLELEERSLIAQENRRRLSKLGGSEPKARPTPRRRFRSR